MKQTMIWSLIWFNVVLLLGFALKQTSRVQAQAFQRPPDLLMVPGQLAGGQGVVYVVNTTTGDLSYITFNDANNRITAMRPLSLVNAFRAVSGGR